MATLAHKLSVKASEVIQYLLTLGSTASVNETIDFDTATIVASEFGFETETSERSEGDILHVNIQASHENLRPETTRGYCYGSRRSWKNLSAGRHTIDTCDRTGSRWDYAAHRSLLRSKLIGENWYSWIPPDMKPSQL